MMNNTIRNKRVKIFLLLSLVGHSYWHNFVLPTVNIHVYILIQTHQLRAIVHQDTIFQILNTLLT